MRSKYPWWPSRKGYAILRLLFEAREPLYGLDMVNRSKGALKRGTIYVTLGRLEEKGLVVGKQEKQKEYQMIPRRFYSLTPLGRKVYQLARTVERIQCYLSR